MLNFLKVFLHQRKQYIVDDTKAVVNKNFCGVPCISKKICDKGCDMCVKICPLNAISKDSKGNISIDLGKCNFCRSCKMVCPIQKIDFTNNYKMSSNDRKMLIVHEGDVGDIKYNPKLIRDEIKGFFGKSLKLRQVSCAGDNSCEMELTAVENVNFDMGRYGITFTASPRHADGIVITGPISENMSEALQICYDAISEPKLVILCGVDAISGGIFAMDKNNAIQRKFLDKYKIDLYIPGNPPHPLTIVNGILNFIRYSKRKGA